jgi:hypothetical protein
LCEIHQSPVPQWSHPQAEGCDLAPALTPFAHSSTQSNRGKEMAQTMVWGMLLAVMLGAFGQFVRVIAGLKKQGDKAAEQGQKLSSVFDPMWTAVSLVIGAIAGIAAFLVFWYGGSPQGVDPTKASIAFGIAAAGYSGTDFIEAFAKKYLPGN